MFILPILFTQTAAPIALQLSQHTFVETRGVASYRVPLEEPARKAKNAVVFRQNRTFVVWDSRGLSVRTGSKVFSTKLPEVAVTPKLFTKPEIHRTLALVKSGVRSRDAAALAGCKRIGSVVYFLVQWSDKSSPPWLEALVSVDLSDRSPRPRLIGRFQGTSLARAAIDDKMFAFDRTPGHPVLAIVSRMGAQWGSASYSPTSSDFAFKPLGSGLVATANLTSTSVAYLVRTSYGTTDLGVVDMRRRTATATYECRGNARLLDNFSPMLELVEDLGARSVHNVSSGATLGLAADAAARRTPLGLLVWWPAAEPKTAVLYDVDRLSEIAKWDSTGTTP